jgi:hypothetical protein
VISSLLTDRATKSLGAATVQPGTSVHVGTSLALAFCWRDTSKPYLQCSSNHGNVSTVEGDGHILVGEQVYWPSSSGRWEVMWEQGFISTASLQRATAALMHGWAGVSLAREACRTKYA